MSRQPTSLVLLHVCLKSIRREACAQYTDRPICLVQRDRSRKSTRTNKQKQDLVEKRNDRPERLLPAAVSAVVLLGEVRRKLLDALESQLDLQG